MAKKRQMQWTPRGESCMTGLPPKFNALRFGTDSAMTHYRVLCLVTRPASISVIVALCCLCDVCRCGRYRHRRGASARTGSSLRRHSGQFNAITDVRGVKVGHTTIVEEGGKLVVGKGPVRTVLPLGESHGDTPVPAAVYSFNGNGEMTGSAWVEESGFLEGPVLLTNTHSVGVVRDAAVEWGARNFPGMGSFSLPVVAETWDGGLNDIDGFHVKKEHVFRASLTGQKVGWWLKATWVGGTGVRAFDFKAGIGTSLRLLAMTEGTFCVSVLVQANLGRREQLIVSGVLVGREITDLQSVFHRDSEKDG